MCEVWILTRRRKERTALFESRNFVARLSEMYDDFMTQLFMNQKKTEKKFKRIW
jgi:hypothetical protein